MEYVVALAVWIALVTFLLILRLSRRISDGEDR